MAGLPEKLNDQAIRLAQKKQFDQAIDLLQTALKHQPGFQPAIHNLATIYNNLGVYHLLNGNITSAISTLEQSVAVDPTYSPALSNLVDLLMNIADFPKIKHYGSQLDKLTKTELNHKQKTGISPFLDLARLQDPKHNSQVATSWSKQYKARDFHKLVSSYPLRLGFISDGFRDYPTAHNLQAVLHSFDRQRFAIYTYSYGPTDETGWSEEIQQAVDHFVNVSGLSDQQIAQKIIQDKINILVDLKGHTRNARPQIFALRPAPLQISYLGFVGSMGSSYHDYFVADRITVPPKIAQYFSEKIIYLPHTYWPTNNKLVPAKLKYSRTDFGIPHQAFVFVSFNQAYKIDEKIFNSWIKILKQVPGSILWLWDRLGLEVINLKKAAAKLGLDPNRLIFSKRLPKAKHLARLVLADLALDTLTVNGHTTTTDCLWVGIPVITILGKHFASRVSASMLSAIGLPQLITTNLSTYEKLAVNLATNPKKLLALKKQLKNNLRTSPLFATHHYTRYLETGLLAANDRLSRGLKPTNIYVSA